MNSTLLIQAIRANNDLQTIASMSEMTMYELKETLIQLIDPSASLTEDIGFDQLVVTPAAKALPEGFEDADDVSIDEIDSDEEDMDTFDRILSQSKVPLSDEQKHFIRLAVKERKSLALLSPAGFGKSLIIETMMKAFSAELKHPDASALRKQYGQFVNVENLRTCRTYGLCASTGKAASLINGKTLHSYFGIGMGKGTVSDWICRVSTARYLKDTLMNLRAVQVIVIDEISMVSAQLLNKLGEYLQRIRRCDLPFGGRQMIVVGDVSQLPPVTGDLFFKSKEYLAAGVQQYRLTKCFRQTDPVFQKILDEIRTGKCSDEAMAILQGCTKPAAKFDGLQPLRIVSTNAEVDAINDRELKKLCDDTHVEMHAFPVKLGADPKKAQKCMKADGIPNAVNLAVGAQVVVIHNVSPPVVVNGTQGVVTQITANGISIKSPSCSTPLVIGYIDLKDPDTLDVYTAKSVLQYLPVRLGWASTVHKAQGSTMECIEVDAKRIWASGQAYVAISRVRSLEGLVIKNLSRRSIVCDKSVKAFLGLNN